MISRVVIVLAFMLWAGGCSCAREEGLPRPPQPHAPAAPQWSTSPAGPSNASRTPVEEALPTPSPHAEAAAREPVEPTAAVEEAEPVRPAYDFPLEIEVEAPEVPPGIEGPSPPPPAEEDTLPIDKRT